MISFPRRFYTPSLLFFSQTCHKKYIVSINILQYSMVSVLTVKVKMLALRM
jgi:hypothetical protein